MCKNCLSSSQIHRIIKIIIVITIIIFGEHENRHVADFFFAFTHMDCRVRSAYGALCTYVRLCLCVCVFLFSSVFFFFFVSKSFFLSIRIESSIEQYTCTRTLTHIEQTYTHTHARVYDYKTRFNKPCFEYQIFILKILFTIYLSYAHH